MKEVVDGVGVVGRPVSWPGWPERGHVAVAELRPWGAAVGSSAPVGLGSA